MTTRKRPDRAAGLAQQSPALLPHLDDASPSSGSELPPPAKRKNHNEGSPLKDVHSPLHTRLDDTPTSKSAAMIHALRALYYAPVAMIVLDQNRNIIMLNEPAEVMLKMDNSACAGQQWDQYLAPSSIETLTLALDEAARRNSSSTSRLSTPLFAKLNINPVQGQSSSSSTSIDLSISAWGEEQDVFGAAQGAHAASPPQPSQQTFFTISLQSSTASESETTANPPRTKQDFDLVKEFALQELDLPFMALSNQGKIVNRNKASDEIWSSLLDIEPTPETDASLGRDDLKEEEFDLSWAYEMANLTEEDWVTPFPQEKWPIYRCAILGERVEPIRLGVESKLTGKRMVIEYVGYPIRTHGGKGEHIGAIMTFRNITAEREALKKEAEHQAENYHKVTCNQMPQLVFAAAHETINAQGSGKHWYNDAWYEYSGAPKEVTSTESWGKYIHPDDFPEAVRLWLDAVEREKLWDFPLRLRRHDGVYRWFQGRALPIRDSSTHKATKWFGTLTDINDQQESLAASRRAQNQLESVINHADVTIWAVDREGIITIAKGPGVKQLKLTTSSTSSGSEKESNDGQCHGEVNKRPHLQTRTSSNSHSNRAIIGRSIYDVWDSTNNIRKALAGESLIEETEIDGRWFRTSYKPMRAQPDEIYSLAGELQSEKDSEVNVVEGEIIGVVGASLDITERKTAQAKMERSMLDKTSALAAEQAAKEASRLKSEFLANMSHEIRTPIAGVIGLSELMLDESGLTNQLRDYAETIRRSAEGLLNVINDVLDFSKVEIGKLDVEKEPFNLDTLLVDAKRMLTFATEKKGLDFKESYNLSYKGLIVGDVGRLKQVLINLLTNAIKFTSRGFVSLEVTEVSEDADKLLLGFDIRDTGCGISKESLARLFQPFSQADPSTARRFGGTGLGLSISKNLVELMGGQIGLDSIEGQGSHAWFRIPMIKAKEVEEEDDNYTVTDKKDEVADETLESHIIERPRGDIWILIAEDNEVNARIAFKNVEKMGFKCRIAENGLLALQELAKRKYDLVLMDCQMPECDGYEATKLMRTSADANIRSLPVIALTASAINGDRERALDAGMVDYLSKPVMRTALETSLCKWLFDQQARQALLKYNRVGLSSPKSGRGAPFMDVGSPTRRKSAAVVKWSENVQVEGTTQAVSPSLVSPSSAADNREAWKEDSRHDPFADHLNVNASESIFTTMARTLSSDQIPGQSKFTNDFVRRPALSKRSQSHGPPSSPSKTIINNNKSNDNDDRL